MYELLLLVFLLNNFEKRFSALSLYFSTQSEKTLRGSLRMDGHTNGTLCLDGCAEGPPLQNQTTTVS